MVRSFTFESVFAALAVLSIHGAMGCSKTESSTAVPEATKGAGSELPALPQASALAEPAPVTPVAVTPATTEATKPQTAPAVDAGREVNIGNRKNGPSAACGATGCSPEIKKHK